MTAELSKLYAAVRNGTVALSQRQTVALAGEVYQLLRNTHDENPGTPGEWAAWKAFTRAALEGRLWEAPPIPIGARTEEEAAARAIFGEDLTAGINALPNDFENQALEQRCGRLALWVLQRHGVEVDRPSHVALLQEIARAALQAGWQPKRQASGDYRPDPLQDRFPPVRTASKGITFGALFERWRIEAKPAQTTIATWRGVVASFVAHLGHHEVEHVTVENVIAWKDRLIGEGKHPKTVNAGHLAGLKTLLNYAKRNRIIAANPADGIHVQARKQAGARMLPYEDAEIARLLQIASRETAPAQTVAPVARSVDRRAHRRACAGMGLTGA